MSIVITSVGDSLTEFPAGAVGVRPSNNWTQVLGRVMRAEGKQVLSRAFGNGGDTTTQILARLDVMFMHETPDIAIIYAGVNDPTNSIVQATTQANYQAMLKVLKFGAVGAGAGLNAGCTVAGQANLPATGRSGQRLVVLTDTSSTGGVAGWHTSHAATITGAGGSAQTVWECRYPLAGELGWGRIATAATAPTHVNRILVVSTHYLNFTASGDTPSTPQTNNAAVRVAQQAAVTAENVTVNARASVAYGDLYAFEKARIQADTDPDFSAVSYDQTKSWHAANSNQHHNEYGHTLIAQAVRAALPSAWLTELA